MQKKIKNILLEKVILELQHYLQKSIQNHLDMMQITQFLKKKTVYYRNTLVRSNYLNNYLNIKQDNSFLIKFYENLLLGKNNNLHSRDLIVEELFNKENCQYETAEKVVFFSQ